MNRSIQILELPSPANLGLDCFLCGSFDLCENCFVPGKRCTQDHELVSGFCAIDSSNTSDLLADCPSTQDSSTKHCYNCHKPENQGIVYRKRK